MNRKVSITTNNGVDPPSLTLTKAIAQEYEKNVSLNIKGIEMNNYFIWKERVIIYTTEYSYLSAHRVFQPGIEEKRKYIATHPQTNFQPPIQRLLDLPNGLNSNASCGGQVASTRRFHILGQVWNSLKPVTQTLKPVMQTLILFRWLAGLF